MARRFYLKVNAICLSWLHACPRWKSGQGLAHHLGPRVIVQGFQRRLNPGGGVSQGIRRAAQWAHIVMDLPGLPTEVVSAIVVQAMGVVGFAHNPLVWAVMQDQLVPVPSTDGAPLATW